MRLCVCVCVWMIGGSRGGAKGRGRGRGLIEESTHPRTSPSLILTPSHVQPSSSPIPTIVLKTRPNRPVKLVESGINQVSDQVITFFKIGSELLNRTNGTDSIYWAVFFL